MAEFPALPYQSTAQADAVVAVGFDFVSAYAASKFGLEGRMESLQAEVAPFGMPYRRIF
jgi:NAD(P)-dependent dehydrogenase (short-subunit alcohol dehydrogenase family)